MIFRACVGYQNSHYKKGLAYAFHKLQLILLIYDIILLNTKLLNAHLFFLEIEDMVIHKPREQVLKELVGQGKV